MSAHLFFDIMRHSSYNLINFAQIITSYQSTHLLNHVGSIKDLFTKDKTLYSMKKLIAAALLSFGFVSMAQAETKLPQWINDVKLSGYVMTQYQYSDQENAKSNSFNLRLGRIALEGRIQHDWYWKVQLQFNGNTSTLGNSPRVVDAFTEWQKYNFFKVKVGQFKRAFTFENPMHPIEQGFFSYSQAINKLSYFSDRSGVRASNGRDIGVQVQGDFLPNAHKRNLLHYQVGVYNGQGINTKDVDQQKT